MNKAWLPLGLIAGGWLFQRGYQSTAWPKRAESFNADSVSEPIYLLQDHASGMRCLGTESFLRAEMLDTYYYSLYDGQDKDFPEDYDSKPIEEILKEIDESGEYYELMKFDFPAYGYWFEPYEKDGYIIIDDFSAKLDANRAKLGTQKVKMVQGWLKEDKEAESFNAELIGEKGKGKQFLRVSDLKKALRKAKDTDKVIAGDLYDEKVYLTTKVFKDGYEVAIVGEDGSHYYDGYMDDWRTMNAESFSVNVENKYGTPKKPKKCGLTGDKCPSSFQRELPCWECNNCGEHDDEEGQNLNKDGKCFTCGSSEGKMLDKPCYECDDGYGSDGCGNHHSTFQFGAESFNADLDDDEYPPANPLRIIIGGPPHSGKSTLMNLLEDKFNQYGVSVELRDLDLASKTDLKGGFDINREKKDWTPELADEAANLFGEPTDDRVILGDSIGLVSQLNEIVSEPADVAILLIGGSYGDNDDEYRAQLLKWDRYYDAIDKPVLMVIRSSMNPNDENYFDPADNYGVIVGLDRPTYQEREEEGRRKGERKISLENACLEGMVFEIAQAYDLRLENEITPAHKENIKRVWPTIQSHRGKPKNPIFGKIEDSYYREKGWSADEFGVEEDVGVGSEKWEKEPKAWKMVMGWWIDNIWGEEHETAEEAVALYDDEVGWGLSIDVPITPYQRMVDAGLTPQKGTEVYEADAESFEATGGYETPIDVSQAFIWETIPADIELTDSQTQDVEDAVVESVAKVAKSVPSQGDFVLDEPEWMVNVNGESYKVKVEWDFRFGHNLEGFYSEFNADENCQHSWHQTMFGSKCRKCGKKYRARNLPRKDDLLDDKMWNDKESFNTKEAPPLESYTKDELIDSIAGPQGSATYDEMEYDPVAQSRLSAEGFKGSDSFATDGETYMANASTHTFEELKARQKKGALEKEIAKKNDWVLEICKANIWEGDNSIKCPNCKDNLNAGWHTGGWKYNQNWSNYSDKKRISALNRFPRGIQCFQCGTMIQMYRDDNAVRSPTTGEWIKPGNLNYKKL